MEMSNEMIRNQQIMMADLAIDWWKMDICALVEVPIQQMFELSFCLM